VSDRGARGEAGRRGEARTDRSLAATPMGRPSMRAASPARVSLTSPVALPTCGVQRQVRRGAKEGVREGEWGTHGEGDVDEAAGVLAQGRDEPARVALSKESVGGSASDMHRVSHLRE